MGRSQVLKVLKGELSASEKTFSPESEYTKYTLHHLSTNDKVKKNSDASCLFCTKTHKTQSCKVMTLVETRKNIIKAKRRCFVCLKGGHISKNCTRKIQCYKYSKRHHIALCDFEQNKNDKVHSQINNDCNETSCNFISPAIFCMQNKNLNI